MILWEGGFPLPYPTIRGQSSQLVCGLVISVISFFVFTTRTKGLKEAKMTIITSFTLNHISLSTLQRFINFKDMLSKVSKSH